MVTDRGQAHALEGITAGLLLLSSLVFAMQMTAVTPLTASTSSQHIENQQREAMRGLLATASETGALRRAILAWDDSNGEFHETPSQGYFSQGPPNEFGRMLNRSFGNSSTAYNVHLSYLSRGNERKRIRYVYQGSPSDNTVTATWMVTLVNDSHLYDASGDKQSTTLSEADTYFAPVANNTAADGHAGPVYNVIEVEVVVWRI